MARICIVTPGQLGSNPRVVKEADALTEAGHDVTVISTRVLEAVEPRDAAVLAQARWRSLRADLREKGRRLAPRLRQEAARRLFGLTGAGADDGFSFYTPALRELVNRTPAELYIGHYPAALPLAGAAARASGGAYAFDAEDFHPGDRAEGEAPDETAILDAIDRRWLEGCAYVSAASPGIAEAYAGRYGLPRPTVVLNVFQAAEAPPAPTPAGSASPGPSVYWFSQTIGPDRGLEWALEAIAKARAKPHLYLRGAIAADYAEALRSQARSLDVEDRLHLLEPIAPDRLIPQMAEYDLAYVGETGHTPNRKIAITNKLFSSLLAGVPVIASDIPAHRGLAELCGGALTLFGLGDTDALAETIDGLLGEPGNLAAARQTAWRLGQERFNWDREKTVLLDLVAGALQRR